MPEPAIEMPETARPRHESAFLPEHLCDGGNHSEPVSLFLSQSLSSGRVQGVKFSPAPAVQFSPLSVDPAAFRQPMESREERAGPYNEYTAGYLFDPVGNSDTVQRPQLERSENQKVECTLQKFSGLCHRKS